MVATTAEAARDIHKIFEAAWNSSTKSSSLPIYYWDDDKALPEGGNAVAQWVHVMFAHVAGGQSALQNDVLCRRDTMTGVLTVRIHTAPGKGQADSNDLIDIVLAGLRRYTSDHCLIIRNPRPLELGREGSFFVSQVLADVEYDTVT